LVRDDLREPARQLLQPLVGCRIARLDGVQPVIAECGAHTAADLRVGDVLHQDRLAEIVAREHDRPSISASMNQAPSGFCGNGHSRRRGWGRSQVTMRVSSARQTNAEPSATAARAQLTLWTAANDITR